MKCPHMHLSREGEFYTCDDCGWELVAVRRQWGPEAPKEPEMGELRVNQPGNPWGIEPPEGHDVPSKF